MFSCTCRVGDDCKCPMLADLQAENERLRKELQAAGVQAKIDEGEIAEREKENERLRSALEIVFGNCADNECSACSCSARTAFAAIKPPDQVEANPPC